MLKDRPAVFPLLLGGILLLALLSGCGDDTTCDVCDTCDPCDPCDSRSREWVVQFPALGSSAWQSMWGSSESNVFVTGDRGQIARYNGSSWQNMNIKSTRTIMGVWGSSANNVYAVGYDGLVLHYDGSGWDPLYLDTITDFYSVWGFSANDVYIGGYRYVYHYDGSDWERIDTGFSYYYYGIWGTSPTNLYMVGSSGIILHYDGAEWTQVEHGLATYYLRGIWGTSSTNIYVVGDRDYSFNANNVLHYNGSTWSRIDDPVLDSGNSHWFYGIVGRNANDIYICSSSSYIFHFDGSDWSEFLTSSEFGYQNLYALWAGPTSLFTGGNCGMIFKHNGSSWSDETGVPLASMQAVWSGDSDNALAVGEYGMILRLDGSSWTDVSTGALENYHYYGLSGVEDNWFIAGSGGVLLQGDASTWEVAGGLGATTNYLYDVWANGDEAIAVGDNGVAVYFNGATQLMMTTGTSMDLRGVWGNSGTDVFAVGDDGVILHFDGNVSNLWEVLDSGVGGGLDLEDVWGTGHNNMYAVGDDGVMVRYNGTSWSRMFTDTYIDFKAIAGTGANNIYVVGSDDVFHYDGSRWVQVPQNATYQTIYDVGCSANDDVFVVGGCATVMHFEEQ